MTKKGINSKPRRARAVIELSDAGAERAAVKRMTRTSVQGVRTGPQEFRRPEF